MIDVNSWISIPDFHGYEIRISTNELKSLNYRKKIGLNKVIVGGLDKTNHKVYRLNNKTVYFHQIVARIKYGYWCPDTLNVCHNDGNPFNNHPDNLRYDTSSSNHKDKFKHGYKSHSEKIVLQYSREGKFLKEWKSATKAALGIGASLNSISNCCRGRYGCKSAGGYKWKYKNES